MPGEPMAQRDARQRALNENTIASIRLLWESRRFLGRVALLGAVLSTLFAFTLPCRYKSAARLMPPDNQSGSGLAMAAATLSAGSPGVGGMASELLGLKSTSDLLVGILNSRTVEDNVINKLELKKVYRVRRMEDARKILAASTEITIDRKSQMIAIEVTGKTPESAEALAQVYVEALNHTLAEVSTSSARRERIFLEERLQTVNLDLEAAEKDFSKFASTNEAIDIKEQGKAMVEAAATLQGQYIAARSELEGLRQLYADGNVRVRSVQARVDELNNQLMKVSGTDDINGVTQEDTPYPSIRKLPLLGVTYADLYRKTRVEEAVYETLTKEYELAKVQEVKEIPTVKVLDPPNLPERRSSPSRRLVLLIGTVLSVACGVTWVFGQKRWEQTDPADPGKVFAQEVFVSIKSSVPWFSLNRFKLHVGIAGTGESTDQANNSKEIGK
jgi:uncharacterized protein involved in exopolysaccharide biosynthesis